MRSNRAHNRPYPWLRSGACARPTGPTARRSRNAGGEMNFKCSESPVEPGCIGARLQRRANPRRGWPLNMLKFLPKRTPTCDALRTFGRVSLWFSSVLTSFARVFWRVHKPPQARAHQNHRPLDGPHRVHSRPWRDGINGLRSSCCLRFACTAERRSADCTRATLTSLILQDASAAHPAQ